MKTATHQWKGMLFIFLLLFSLSSYTQDNTQNVEEFVRVYNLDGKKIGKGNINFINDTIIKIRKGGRIESIKIKDIGIIKTKHSAGHNVLIGAAVGGGTLGVLGAATADPDDWVLGYSAPEGFAVGLVIGGATKIFPICAASVYKPDPGGRSSQLWHSGELQGHCPGHRKQCSHGIDSGETLYWKMEEY